MEDNKMKTEQQRRMYETPRVDCTCWDEDVLAANGSTDVGSEYPGDWA